MNPISQSPERIEYMYELEHLQSTNTCEVGSGHDQCVWPVGVVAGCGHWVGHGMMISG